MGRPQFSQPINVVSSSSKKVRFLEVTSGTPVAIGATDALTIYSPVGTVGKVKAVYVKFPTVVGAVSGNKSFSVSLAQAQVINLSYVFGAYNVDQIIEYLTPIGHTSCLPTDLSAFTAALKDVQFDDVTGFRVTFVNSTNVITAETRIVRVYVEQEAVN